MCSSLTLQKTESADAFAIRVTGLGKFFRLYDKPEDRLKESFYARINRVLGRGPVSYCREFKALDGVSFDVRKGETVGIIGRNGSGKSTMLQLISGTLTPSHGQVEVNGRVAALLELGSGFHPDFSGRENVYMNAALFGVGKEETDAKFSDIARFADIGDFMEQPVKTYSSGMMLRLAFAVIAHIDADILVIDEALSVGDAVFTQKCMRFIKAFQEQGSLLFVSHDMAAVQNLCERTIWLDQGEVRAMGVTRDITNEYLRYTLQEIYGEDHRLDSAAPARPVDGPEEDSTPSALDYEAALSVRDNRPDSRGWTTGAAEIRSVSLTRRDNENTDVLKGGEKVRLSIEAVAHEDIEQPIIGFIVNDRLGQDLFGENTLPFTSDSPLFVKAGAAIRADFDFHLPMLPNGEYVVMTSIADGNLHENVQHHLLHDALVITVSSSKVRWGLAGIPFESVSLEIVDA